MPGVLLGVSMTPMGAVEELLHPVRPNVNKPKVKRAINPQSSNRADVKRFTIPPAHGRLEFLPISSKEHHHSANWLLQVTEVLSLCGVTKGVVTSDAPLDPSASDWMIFRCAQRWQNQASRISV